MCATANYTESPNCEWERPQTGRTQFGSGPGGKSLLVSPRPGLARAAAAGRIPHITCEDTPCRGCKITAAFGILLGVNEAAARHREGVIMCILAILYRVARGTPILVAANREAALTGLPSIPNSSRAPARCVWDRSPSRWHVAGRESIRVVLRRDQSAQAARAAGAALARTLCRELLDFRSARDAAAYAAKELATGAYAGAMIRRSTCATRWSSMAPTKWRSSSCRPACT